MKRKKSPELVALLKSKIEEDIAEAKEKTGREFCSKVGILLEDCLLSPSDADSRVLGHLSYFLRSAQLSSKDRANPACFRTVFNIPAAVSGYYHSGYSYILDELAKYARELIERDPELRIPKKREIRR